LATRVQRLIAIGNALADPNTPSNALMLRIANAFVVQYHPGVDPATLTNEQKSGVVIRAIREFVQNTLSAGEANPAAEAARRTALQNAIIDLGNDGGLP
jgi:hypothetical protein